MNGAVSRVAAALAVSLLGLAHAADLEGRVVSVHDGDSLTLSLDGPAIASGRPIKIRLDSIDARTNTAAGRHRVVPTHPVRCFPVGRAGYCFLGEAGRSILKPFGPPRLGPRSLLYGGGPMV